MSNTAEKLPDWYAAETKAREIIATKKAADKDYQAGLADPILGHFINKLCPEYDQ